MQNFYNFLGLVLKDGEVIPPENPPPTFTQDQVNGFVAAEKKKLRAEIEALKKAGDPAALQAKLKEISEQMATKEELAREALAAAELARENAVKEATAESQIWKDRYSNMTFKTEVAKAATKHIAFSDEQLGLLVTPHSKVVEVTDATGKGVGEFVVKTTYHSPDGKKLELTLDEAVAKMREDPRYANQFRPQGTPGTGITLNNHPAGGGNAGGSEGPPKDAKAYMAWYKAQRLAGKFN